MIDIKELLADLSSRLPELEWKISGLNASISNHNLPRGLFRWSSEPTGLSCIAEIKSDIYALSHQTNERSAAYLAQQIQKKINVLVTLCQRQGREKKTSPREPFGVSRLSTRQQWIHSLEEEVQTLTKQQQAMSKALDQMLQSGNALAILSLQGELGELGRRMTLAQEALTKVTT
ncbi:MAG: hypothetical protein ACHP6H_05070 [Legionellales bacterium]